MNKETAGLPFKGSLGMVFVCMIGSFYSVINNGLQADFEKTT
jgi:hypothetical protein